MTRQIGPSVTAVPGGSGPRSGSTEAAFQCVNLGGGGEYIHYQQDLSVI